MVAVTCFSQKNIFPHSGTLIIIGGGSMPDTLYQAFAKLIGGKNQPVVYIPTATGDEEWIQDEEAFMTSGSQL
jgi:peptidase E